MSKIAKLILLVFLSAVCTACNTIRPINLEKLHDKKNKIGLVIFRPIYTDYSNNKEAIDLTRDSELTMYITSKTKRPSSSNCDYKRDCCYIHCHQNDPQPSSWPSCTVGKKFAREIFIKEDLLFFPRKTSFKPEYFYVLLELPEGEYNFSLDKFESIDSYMGRLQLPGIYRFSVQAGKINYIGDLLITATSTKILSKGFLSLHYEHDFVISQKDSIRNAQSFMEKFYPEVDLPFTKSLAKRIPHEETKYSR